MSIIIWLLVGALSGWLAGKIMKGKGFGLLGNIVVGILGSILGGWLAGVLGFGGASSGSLSISGIITAVIGAIVLLFIVGKVKK